MTRSSRRGAHTASVETDPARAREVLVPGLRTITRPDRRSALPTIYRLALADGIIDRVTSPDCPKTLPNRSGKPSSRSLHTKGLRRRARALSGELLGHSNRIARGMDRGFSPTTPARQSGLCTRDLSARRSGITRFDIETRNSARSEDRVHCNQSSSQSVDDPAPHASPTPRTKRS